MCGIVGYVGNQQCADILLGGLTKLEYRGYDSAGIATIESGALQVRRSEGKLINLKETVAQQPISGQAGIGHTRWATHGGPTEANAHPHRSGNIAVVHNGIIENYLILKKQLQQAGKVFLSETDTEVIAHLIATEKEKGLELKEAVANAVKQLEGAYSIVVIDADEPDTLIVARLASPLVLGFGEDENFVASDLPALLAHTRKVMFMDDDTMAVVRPSGVEITRVADGSEAPIKQKEISWSPTAADKGQYKHYMLKEIFEQPDVIEETLKDRYSLEDAEVILPEIGLTPEKIEQYDKIYIVACGTSWHAGLVGRYLFEDLAGMSPHVELASELRYRNAPIDDRTLILALSQSGETADTLAAIRDAKTKGATILSICNVLESSIPRESLGTVYTHAGPEIGVASTKAFTTQLIALHLLALQFGKLSGKLDDETMRQELAALASVPSLMKQQLYNGMQWKDLAQFLAPAQSVLFLGRGSLFPIALEGALKLKEISYIHAEGYAAGEMKHGPIALISEEVPSVILNPKDEHHDKVRSNLQEVKARGGPVVAVVSVDDIDISDVLDDRDRVIEMPASANNHILPLLVSIPMQLIAYHVANLKGTDVDQPRNLAKSVTVE